MPSTRPKALVSWSSGKDSAYALVETLRRGDYEVAGLLTTVTADHERVSMHGVRESLLDRQVHALRLPCRKVYIPAPCPNEVYEREMKHALEAAKAEGIEHVIFGDLFLEDIRAYREEHSRRIGVTAVFPLWLRDTAALVREMLAAGLSATTTCIDPRRLDPSFAGRTIDPRFLADLPPSVDPCGENGEFHTFVTDGPMFTRAIEIEAGPVVEREGFVFADLLPK